MTPAMTSAMKIMREAHELFQIFINFLLQKHIRWLMLWPLQRYPQKIIYFMMFKNGLLRPTHGPHDVYDAVIGEGKSSFLWLRSCLKLGYVANVHEPEMGFVFCQNQYLLRKPPSLNLTMKSNLNLIKT